MFGYTKPISLDLTLRENNNYRAHYCGLCRTLSRQYGVHWRMTTNYESTLLALLLSAQVEEGPEYGKYFCPVAGPKRYLALQPSSMVGRAAAAFTVLMGLFKAQDLRRDGAIYGSLAHQIAKGPARQAQKQLGLSGFRVDLLVDLEAEQEKLEAESQEGHPVNLDQLTVPSSKGLGLVFSHTAKLSGLMSNTYPLQRIGCAAGQIIYILDCLDDLQSDLAKNRFNALVASGLVSGGKLNAAGQGALDYLWVRTADEISMALTELKVYRFAGILENVFCDGLVGRFKHRLEQHGPDLATNKNT